MQNISVEELKARMDAGEKIHLIDCREPHEYAEFKEEEVIIHCRSGVRSGQACMLLDTMGFKNTKNVTGGILEWQNKFGSNS